MIINAKSFKGTGIALLDLDLSALDWSGIATGFHVELFHKMLVTYQQSGGLFQSHIIEDAFYGVIGNWINWMVYNIDRAMLSKDLEQKNIGIEQVTQVILTILRIKNLVPKLINDIYS